MDIRWVKYCTTIPKILGLIDEINIGITPILLGSGKRLFDNIGKHIELILIKTKQYEEDLVELNYRINI